VILVDVVAGDGLAINVEEASIYVEGGDGPGNVKLCKVVACDPPPRVEVLVQSGVRAMGGVTDACTAEVLERAVITVSAHRRARDGVHCKQIESLRVVVALQMVEVTVGGLSDHFAGDAYAQQGVAYLPLRREALAVGCQVAMLHERAHHRAGDAEHIQSL